VATDDDCTTFAIHDLAALAEGNLSPDGMERLARHLRQCHACMATLAAIVDEAQPSEGTGDMGLAAWIARAMATSGGGNDDDSRGYASSPDPQPDRGQHRSRRQGK
jgi:hypothetical protein